MAGGYSGRYGRVAWNMVGARGTAATPPPHLVDTDSRLVEHFVDGGSSFGQPPGAYHAIAGLSRYGKAEVCAVTTECEMLDCNSSAHHAVARPHAC